MQAEIQAMKDEIMDIFTHLHQHPEVSFHEEKTRAYICQLAEAEGLTPQTFSSHYGIIVDVGDQPPEVALRTDMDALWQESSGVMQANHSCGHDAHMTMGIAAMLYFARHEREAMSVRFIFQPAEEKGEGAKLMVRDGAVENITHLYGVHLRPEAEVPAGQAAPAIQNGAAQFLYGTIAGEDAHGARPHLGVNAVEVGVALVQRLQSIHTNPMVPASAKFTRFEAGGESQNVIPGRARFSLDVRAQTNEVMEELIAGVEKGVRGVSEAYGTNITLEYGASIPAAEIHEEAKEQLAAAIRETLGNEALHPVAVSSGGEDFHNYTIKQPELKAAMLGLGCGLTPGLHHPEMTFDRDAMIDGVEILTRALLSHTI
ncbi:amidohydrolase [Salsuginibacillus halophilus]|uniref:Amidohydrolase n=1 Tax=Salsuginibacillus halophilus TaxID=517424 RepID=A0A2P8HQX1_9BACI|nr:amidohydrolase [Salsuginibacillus halophilus]PSL48616.1 amidohydrolase [Salsuginibacillus halophilus]